MAGVAKMFYHLHVQMHTEILIWMGDRCAVLTGVDGDTFDQKPDMVIRPGATVDNMIMALVACLLDCGVTANIRTRFAKSAEHRALRKVKETTKAENGDWETAVNAAADKGILSASPGDSTSYQMAANETTYDAIATLPWGLHVQWVRSTWHAVCVLV